MGSFRPLTAPDSCGVKASEVIDIPYSLDRSWRRAIRAELDAAEEELPRLSKAAFELAALVMSGEYDVVAVGKILESDEELTACCCVICNTRTRIIIILMM